MDQKYNIRKAQLIPTEVLTESEVKTLAQRVWNVNTEVVKYRIDAYSNEKLGYLGSHLCLQLTIRKKDTGVTESKTFFVKNLPQNDIALAYSMEDMGVFDHEVAFYKQIAPLLKKELENESWGPKCYMITKNSLVFEDLRIKGFSMRNRLLNKEEIISALSTIARIHAASILAEKKLGKPLNKIFPKALNINSFIDVNGLRHKWFLSGISFTITLAKRLGLETGKIRAAFDRMVEGLKPSQGKYNVVSHADLWSNNMMFDNNSPPNCLLVDYQMTRYCPLVHDVILLLYLCTNQMFRIKHEQEMLEYYYETLCDTLRNKQPKIQVPAWSEITQSCEEQRLGIVIITVLYLPATLMDSKTCAEHCTDPDDYMQFLFGDKTETTFSLMQRDKVYEERIKESVIELVGLAERLQELPRPC